MPSWTCNWVFALSNVQACAESSSLKLEHWVKCLLGVFVLTSANLPEAGRKGLVLLRAIPRVCCRAWVCQETVRAFGNLTISHDMNTYLFSIFLPALPFGARDELSLGAWTNPAGVLSFL